MLCAVWLGFCIELLIQTEAQMVANIFKTEKFKLVQSEKEQFSTSGYIKMQGNWVSECILVLGLSLTKFPLKVQATKAAGGCYLAEY